MTRGQYSLEAHLNLVTQGTLDRDGTLLPTEHQTHLTLEPTFGVSENFAVGFMFLNAWQPGYTPQFAGWRVLHISMRRNRGICRFVSALSRSFRSKKCGMRR